MISNLLIVLAISNRIMMAAGLDGGGLNETASVIIGEATLGVEPKNDTACTELFDDWFFDDSSDYFYSGHPSECTDPVIDYIGNETAPNYLEFAGPKIVLFYSTSCPYSQEVKSPYIELARNATALYPTAKFFAVSCDAWEEVCKERHGIYHTPTFKVYGQGSHWVHGESNYDEKYFAGLLQKERMKRFAMIYVKKVFGRASRTIPPARPTSPYHSGTSPPARPKHLHTDNSDRTYEYFSMIMVMIVFLVLIALQAILRATRPESYEKLSKEDTSNQVIRNDEIPLA